MSKDKTMKKFASYLISHLRILYLIAILSVSVALILLMFPDSYSKVAYSYTPGSFWQNEDLYAPFDFTILKSNEESSREAQHIRETSTSYFHIDSSAREKAVMNAARQQMQRRDAMVVDEAIALIYNSKGYCANASELNGHPLVVLSGNIGYEIDPDGIMTPSDVEQFVMQTVSDTAGATADRLDSDTDPGVRREPHPSGTRHTPFATLLLVKNDRKRRTHCGQGPAH